MKTWLVRQVLFSEDAKLDKPYWVKELSDRRGNIEVLLMGLSYIDSHFVSETEAQKRVDYLNAGK